MNKYTTLTNTVEMSLDIYTHLTCVLSLTKEQIIQCLSSEGIVLFGNTYEVPFDDLIDLLKNIGDNRSIKGEITFNCLAPFNAL